MLHECLVPLAFDNHLCQGLQLDCLDQIVGEVVVDCSLPERVGGGTCRNAADEPSLHTLSVWTRERALLPAIVAVTTDPVGGKHNRR